MALTTTLPTSKLFLRAVAKMSAASTFSSEASVSLKLGSQRLSGVAPFMKTSIRFLSQGQRKRVALADAILLRPRLLLLDDVIAGIDDESRTAIASALKTVSATSTVIVTGHERECLSKFVTRFMEFEA